MQAMANIGLRAARQASQAMLRAMDRLDRLHVEAKAQNDFVSEVDREAEAIIVEALHKSYPGHGIRGEESGQIYPESDYNWIIDPLDGTTNYIQGIPHFCISIAAMKGNQFEHGIIVDPLRNEEFVASRGSGAHLNGKRIRVSNTVKVESALFATGLPPASVAGFLDTYLDILKDFSSRCCGFRRFGSAALDLAYVAAGRVDGFFEPGLKPWDVAAGALIVREAGGFVGDFEGGDKFIESGNIVAANPRLFKAMIQTMRLYV